MVQVPQAIQQDLALTTARASGGSFVKGKGSPLNDAQSEVCQEFLEWLERRTPRLQALRGYAGAGKSYMLKYALQQAWDRGLIVGNVWGCAPTHQAVRVLTNAMEGCPISEVVTAHALLGLRPQKVLFDHSDESTLVSLLAIPADERTTDDEAVIDGLRVKQNKADEGCQDFVSAKLKTGIENVRLIIVDECSMIDRYLFGLFCSLTTNPELHPDLQILFVGDPAQLPPVNEALSKTLELPHFTELTKVVRYTGSILDYCNQVRTVADYEWLHRRMIEDDTLMILQSFEVMSQIRELYDSGESIRFVAATNKRVTELNYQIRSLLHSDSEQLFYEPGDVVLTLNAVQRESHGAYDLACQGRNAKLEAHTSTLLELGEPCLPGDFVSIGSGNGVRLTDDSFSFTSSLGTKFERLLYRYRHYDAGEDFAMQPAICLINPEQYAQWRSEIKQLLARARTTQTRSKRKGARGQEGDSAKEVWKEFGLKDWSKWLDGRPVSDYEYRNIKGQLWSDYYALLGFADQASYSYASSCHRCLPGDTLIKSDGNSLVKLEDIKVGDLVATGKGTFSRVSKKWQTGIKKSLTLKTKSGKTITTSEDHKFLCSHDGYRPHWYSAKVIKTGYYLCLDRSITNSANYIALPKVQYSGRGSELNITVPEFMTSDLAWMMGALIGDGAIKDEIEGRIDFCTDLKDISVHHRMMFLAKSFGLNPVERRSTEGNASIQIYWHSKPFRMWLNRIGLGFNGSVDKTVPWSIIESDSIVQAAFLQGLFDTDGCVDTNRNIVRLVTVSEQIKDLVQIMLLSLGIVSRVQERAPSNSNTMPIQGRHRSFAIAISGDGLVKFAENIGFSSDRKAALLSEKLTHHKGKTNVDYVPFGASLVEEFRSLTPSAKGQKGKGLYAGQKENGYLNDFAFLKPVLDGKRKLSQFNLRLMATTLSNLGIETETQEIEDFAAWNLFFDPVVSIEEGPELEMFDIEVENDHQFVANGFVVHNCQGVTLDVVVVDMQSIVSGPSRKWQKEGDESTWDTRKLLYTAATRARKQLVFMV